MAHPSATYGNHLQTGCFSFYFFPTPVSLTLCSQIDLHSLLSTFLRSLNARRAPVVRCFHPHQVETLLSGFHCNPGPGWVHLFCHPPSCFLSSSVPVSTLGAAASEVLIPASLPSLESFPWPGSAFSSA